MFTIRRNGNRWQVCDADGTVVLTGNLNDCARFVYGRAAHALATVTAAVGTLPERWTGVWCYQGVTGDGRDLSGCEFTLRDVPLPLMFQSVNDMGHFGADLAGFADQATVVNGRVEASGLFHDSDAGRALRDVLAAQGRFGVSVDGGAADAEWDCTETDPDGVCVDGTMVFTTLEVMGATATPFPALPDAYVELDAASADQPTDQPDATDAPVDAVAAAAGVLTAPPSAWFTFPEPDDDSPLLIAQPDGQAGVPLTITDDGHVFGHAALWGTCHIGYPNSCVTPPDSPSSYAHFHVGEVRCADGSAFAVGTLTAGTDHAARELLASDARDHYSHTGLAWADVRAVSGRFGVWVTGALRPDVTADQVRVLRASALSGDWRRIGGALEMIGVLSVNVPGFPIAREVAASAALDLADAVTAYVERAGAPLALVASGLVRPDDAAVDALVAAGTLARCTTCGQDLARRRHQPEPGLRDVLAVLRSIDARLAVVEARTETLNTQRAAQALARLAEVRGTLTNATP